MSLRNGLLVYTSQPTNIEYSVPIKHIMRISYASITGITTVTLVDGSSEIFQTMTDDFYQSLKKEISTAVVASQSSS